MRLPKGYVKITDIGGQYPVQARGTIDGHDFYFRARHNFWTLTIACPGEDPVTVDVLFRSSPQYCLYHYDEDYGTGNEAGYMPVKEVRKCIRQCASEYLAQQKEEKVA